MLLIVAFLLVPAEGPLEPATQNDPITGLSALNQFDTPLRFNRPPGRPPDGGWRTADIGSVPTVRAVGRTKGAQQDLSPSDAPVTDAGDVVVVYESGRSPSFSSVDPSSDVSAKVYPPARGSVRQPNQRTQKEGGGGVGQSAAMWSVEPSAVTTCWARVASIGRPR